jgi:predicted GIY-YIG superfamily endonuclease
MSSRAAKRGIAIVRNDVIPSRQARDRDRPERGHSREPIAHAVRRVTGDVTGLVLRHKAGVGSRFTGRYAITRLVYIEIANGARDAIAREKQIKGWSRAKKVALIEGATTTAIPPSSLALVRAGASRLGMTTVP